MNEKSYEHKDLLNRLSDMQRSPYYALACQTLVQAEMVIVALEDERRKLKAAQSIQPLTDEQIRQMYIKNNWYEMHDSFTWGAASVVARLIEAAIRGQK